MTYKSIVISSGHSQAVQGAVGILNEVDEARRVVEDLANRLRERGVDVTTYHDDISKTQSDNLERIVAYHNKLRSRSRPECSLQRLRRDDKVDGHKSASTRQRSDSTLAAQLSAAIADVGLPDRGAKQRKDLIFWQTRPPRPCSSRSASLIASCRPPKSTTSGSMSSAKTWLDVLGGEE